MDHYENGDYSNDEEALNNFDFLDYLKIAADEGFSGYGLGRGSHHHEPPAPRILRQQHHDYNRRGEQLAHSLYQMHELQDLQPFLNF